MLPRTFRRRPTPATLRADLAKRAFGLGAPPRPRRVGAEVELIPVCAESRAPVPILAGEGPSSLPFLRRFAAGRGWREERTAHGAPCFALPDGGIVSYEPGGQIELSTPPLPSAGALLEALGGTVPPLRAAARDEGIELLDVGMDPYNPLEAVPLRLHGARYGRMAEHLARIGPWGGRMMRQTASLQLHLDWEGEPPARWRVLNAAAPYLLATFANSPVYAGSPVEHRSFRAHAWRELDPARTGAFAAGEDPVGEYLAFALGAPALLREGEPRPAGEWIARGEMTWREWDAHLTTLFPEVRPRGHAEVRSLDALPPEWYAAPLVLLLGITHDPSAAREADALLPPPEPELLRRAGRLGVSDPEIGSVARDLFEIGLRGAEALDRAFLPADALEAAREFFGRYTRRGLAPADDLRPAALC